MKTKEERNNINLEKEKEQRMEAEKKEKIAFYKQQVLMLVGISQY